MRGCRVLVSSVIGFVLWNIGVQDFLITWYWFIAPYTVISVVVLLKLVAMSEMLMILLLRDARLC